METIDWTKLANVVEPKKDRIPYEPNKHLFTKVAFDVFQLNTSPVESLWVLETNDDGTEYLAAMYGEDDPEQLEVTSSWKALSDRDSENVTLVYKDVPLQRFASTDYGFDKSDIHIFQRTLISKLSSDKDFRNKFLNSQPKEKREMILQQFPELV